MLTFLFYLHASILILFIQKTNKNTSERVTNLHYETRKRYPFKFWAVNNKILSY